MKNTIIIIAVAIITIIAIGFSYSYKKPLPLRTDISLYDSAGNLVAFKHKKEWHILNGEKTAESLLKELMSLNRYNQIISFKYDSIVRANKQKNKP